MAKTPLHLWIVGLAGLLWNAGGASDYVMTKLNAPEYLAAQPPARLEMLEQAPQWFTISWACGVWFSVLGSLLLLARSRFAGSAFALSLLGLIVSSIYTFGMAEGGAMLAVAGTGAIVFSIAIPVVLIGLFVYSRAMRQRGVLR